MKSVYLSLGQLFLLLLLTLITINGLPLTPKENQDDGITHLEKIIRLANSNSAWDNLEKVASIINSPLIHNLTLNLVNDPELTLSLLNSCPTLSASISDLFEQISNNKTNFDEKMISNSNSTLGSQIRKDLFQVNNITSEEWKSKFEKYILSNSIKSNIKTNEMIQLESGLGLGNSTLTSCNVLGPMGAMVGAIGALVSYISKNQVAGNGVDQFLAYISMMIATTFNGPFLLSTVACNPEKFASLFG
eukprot:c6528_g1_i1.p1 GENE.c6528_g1_i1~~c6528_g1_i1.p1  ORF type:complete len:247 (+),score=104.56 c6528_g1_i1:55-795(+)